MATQNNPIKGNLEFAAKNLAVCIQYTEPINRYLIAKEKFDQDLTARKILEELSDTQRSIRQKQADNSISADDLEKLRSLQVKAQENKSINTFAFAQQEAIGYLKEINSEVSNLLGIDFSSLAKKTSC